jgi:hypothetical protein
VTEVEVVITPVAYVGGALSIRGDSRRERSLEDFIEQRHNVVTSSWFCEPYVEKSGSAVRKEDHRKLGHEDVGGSISVESLFEMSLQVSVVAQCSRRQGLIQIVGVIGKNSLEWTGEENAADDQRAEEVKNEANP